MVKDIGIVLLPNDECKKFAQHMQAETSKALPTFEQLPTHPHITLIHIANINESQEAKLHEAFQQFAHSAASDTIPLPIKGIKATGGNEQEGYKWLDLQFETDPKLAQLQKAAVERFCSFHNGILTRMYDDMDKFIPSQREDIKNCGVTYSNYLPHISTWYVNLPHEQKTVHLQQIADSMSLNIPELECSAEAIALVVLGRNGNAESIIEQYTLGVHTEL
jgi:hypothetical protein